MSGILTYVLHYEGEFNKNSLGAVSEAAKLAGEIGGEAAAIVVGGDDLTDELCATLGKYGATKVYRAKGPEGLAQPVVDAMAKVIEDNDFSYALFGGGLLGFEIGAGVGARLNGGVTMEVTAVKVQDGKLVAERPILQDSAIVDVDYAGTPGRDHRPPERVRDRRDRRRRRHGRGRRRRAVRLVDQGHDGPARRAARRRREHRGRRHPRGRRPRARQGRGLQALPRTSPRRSAAPWRPPARWSTPAGTRTPPRSARPARRSRRSCTWRPASRARSSTRSACSRARTSSRSTRTRTRRSSSSPTSASSAT